jgi:hypothetical protein
MPILGNTCKIPEFMVSLKKWDLTVYDDYKRVGGSSPVSSFYKTLIISGFFFL